jgi:hypothetical protein
MARILRTNQTRRTRLTYTSTALRNVLVAAVLASASVVARAAIVPLKASLIAASEVPAKDSPGRGTLSGALDTDTNEFRYHVEFSGLTGPVTAAHFHGPAAEGVNAKPQIPIKTNPIDSPVEGKTTITPEQAKDLLDGKWYFNLHTSANPGGEIRGQVLKAQ